MLSVLTGRKIEDDLYGTRTNVMILGLAPSGSGKEHARKKVKQLLALAGASDLLGPERIGSSAGIVSHLDAKRSLLFQIDEIGRLLQTMQSATKASYLFNVASVLMSVYTASGTHWVADAYAELKKTRAIDDPHCVVYGTSTAPAVWDGLVPSNATDGLIGRMCVFTENYVEVQKPKNVGFPDELVNAARLWNAFNIGDGTIPDNNQKNVLVAKYTPEAEARSLGHLAAISKRRIGEDAVQAAIWSRCSDKTSKLALLFACSEGPAANIVVDVHHVNLAIKLAKWLTHQILDGCGQLAEDKQHRNLLKVFEVITKNKKLTRTELTRKTQFVRRKERNEILLELKESGKILNSTNGDFLAIEEN